MHTSSPRRGFLTSHRIAIIVATVALALSPRWAAAQGLLNYSTRVTGSVVSPIYGPETGNPSLSLTGNTSAGTPTGTTVYTGGTLQGSGFSAQLFAAAGADQPESALTAVATSVTWFRTGATLGGHIVPSTQTIPQVAELAIGTFQLRVWDNLGGTIPTWANAQPLWETGALAAGKSLLFNAGPLGGGVVFPPDMINFRSFNIYYLNYPPTILQQPQSQSVVTGSNATFSVTASSSFPMAYQWRKDGVAISGATNANYSLAAVTPVDAGYYDVIVGNAFGTVTSAAAVLQVLPFGAPSIRVNNQLAVGTVTVGGSATVGITGGFPGGIIFYTLDGSTPSTSSPLYTGPFTLTNSATVRAMSLSADFTQESHAPAVNVVVLPVYNLVSSVSGSGSISRNPPTGPYLSNSVVTLTAIAATNWAFSHWTGDLSGSANPVSLVMNGPRSVQAVFVPTAYPLTVSTPGGGSVTVNGQTIAPNTYYPTGSVVSLEAAPGSGWSFLRWQGTASSTANPFALTMNQTQNVQAIFGTVVGTNVSGNGRIVLGGTNPVPFGTVLTVTAVPDLGHYFVTWSGAASGTNNPTTVTVTSPTPLVGALFAVSPAPTILTQPTNISVVLGNSATFSVGASGAPPLTYQWRKGGTNLSGATHTSYTIPGVVVADAGNYDVVVVNGYGSAVTSSVATLTVLLPAGIAQQPQSQIVVVGSNATLTVTASGTPPFTYQWRRQGVPIGGAVGSSHTIIGATTNHAGGYDVVVANPYGSVTSAVAVLTVVFPPTIVLHPMSQTAASGSSVSFSVFATGTEPLSYQWRDGGGNIPGATNAVFSLNPALTNHAGPYSVVVTNPYGAATSGVASLTVFIPVTITSQPVSQVVPWRGTATFEVGAGGYPAPEYQWLFNGDWLWEASASSLVVTNVGTNALGDYAVVVWNDYSVTTSAVAVLRMSPSLRVPFAGATAIWGKSATLSVSAVGSGELSYQWFKDGAPLGWGTNATLEFGAVQISDGGLYSVVVSSLYGSVTNTPAQLVVNPANIALGLYAGVIIDGVPGYTYGIEYSTDLTDTNAWSFITNVTLTEPVEIWVDTSVNVHAPGVRKRFYRVLAQ